MCIAIAQAQGSNVCNHRTCDHCRLLFCSPFSEALLLAHNFLVRVLLVGDNDQVVGAVWVDLDLAELARGNAVLEEDVQLGVGETCGRDVSDCNRVERMLEDVPFGSGRRK